jgi:hypothetical protein
LQQPGIISRIFGESNATARLLKLKEAAGIYQVARL